MAVLPRSGEIVLTEMSQRFHIDHLGRVMDAALQGCQVIINPMLTKLCSYDNDSLKDYFLK